MKNNTEQCYHQYGNASPSWYTPYPPSLQQQYPGVTSMLIHRGVIVPAQPQTQPQIQPLVQPQVQPRVQPQTQPQIQPSVQPRVQPQPQKQTQTLECVLPDGQDLASALDFFSQCGKLRGFRFERLARGTKLLVQYQKEAALSQALAQCQPNGITASVNLMPFLSDPTILIRVNNSTLPESAICQLFRIDQTSVIRTSSTEGTGYLLRFRSKDAKANALCSGRICIRKVRVDIKRESKHIKVCPTAPLELAVVRKFFEDNYGDLESITLDRSITFTFATREKADAVVEQGKQVPSELATVTYSTYKNTAAKRQEQKKTKQKKLPQQIQQLLSQPPQQFQSQQQLLPQHQPTNGTGQQALMPSPHTPKYWKIANHVGNIPPNTTEDNLMTAFAEFNPIGASVKTDSKGNIFGMVGFKSEEERAVAASEMNGALWNGQTITCNKFLHKPRASTPEPTPGFGGDGLH